MDLKSKIILIYGPTASGKSDFAIKLAKKIKGEIINADSMQVYKELKILTARPLKNDLKKIKHHLYGFQSSKKNFSTGAWLKLANQSYENRPQWLSHTIHGFIAFMWFNATVIFGSLIGQFIGSIAFLGLGIFSIQPHISH